MAAMSAPPPALQSRSARLGRVLSLLGQGVLAFHPRLVQLTGSLSSALMLSQSLYWTRIKAERGDKDAWFWKTRESWRAEIGLSRHEQDSARKRLLLAGVVEERRAGMPARLWFRVDLDRLAHALDQDFTGHWDWHDQQALARMLGRPLLVYRIVATLCGSVTSAVLLSRLLMSERILARSEKAGDLDPWRRFDVAEVLRTTGLTRAEYYHARKQLRSLGLIEERRIGIPPRSEYRIQLEQLAVALEQQLTPISVTTTATDTTPGTVIHRPDAAPQRVLDLGQEAQNEATTRVVDQLAGIDTDSMRVNHIQGCGKPANKDAAKPHPDYPESGQLNLAIPANLMAGNKTHRWPDSGHPIKKLTTCTSTTEEHLPPTPSQVQHTSVPAAGNEVGGGGCLHALIWPTTLLPSERPIAEQLLVSIPDLAQLVLDELAGQALQTVIHKPLAYLRRLVEQARVGQFIPVVAARISEGRARAESIRRQREAAGVGSPAPQTTFKLTEAQREARRKDLEAMRKRLASASLFSSSRLIST